MVVDWEQETGLLMSSGDVRIVRIWDTDREMKVQVTAQCPPAVYTLLMENQDQESLSSCETTVTQGRGWTSGAWVLGAA